jgi:hypothetical protein
LWNHDLAVALWKCQLLFGRDGERCHGCVCVLSICWSVGAVGKVSRDGGRADLCIVMVLVEGNPDMLFWLP